MIIAKKKKQTEGENQLYLLCSLNSIM